MLLIAGGVISAALLWLGPQIGAAARTRSLHLAWGLRACGGRAGRLRPLVVGPRRLERRSDRRLVRRDARPRLVGGPLARHPRRPGCQRDAVQDSEGLHRARARHGRRDRQPLDGGKPGPVPRGRQHRLVGTRPDRHRARHRPGRAAPRCPGRGQGTLDPCRHRVRDRGDADPGRGCRAERRRGARQPVLAGSAADGRTGVDGGRDGRLAEGRRRSRRRGGAACRRAGRADGRQPDAAADAALLREPPRRRCDAGRRQERPAGPPLHRPRRLQAGQRHLRPQRRRPRARAGRPAPEVDVARQGRGRPRRRR